MKYNIFEIPNLIYNFGRGCIDEYLIPSVGLLLLCLETG